MTSDEVVAYPKTEDKFWMTVLRNSGEFSDMKLGEMPYDAETARMLNVVKNLRTMNPMQARMEAIEIK